VYKQTAVGAGPGSGAACRTGAPLRALGAQFALLSARLSGCESARLRLACRRQRQALPQLNFKHTSEKRNPALSFPLSEDYCDNLIGEIIGRDYLRPSTEFAKMLSWK